MMPARKHNLLTALAAFVLLVVAMGCASSRQAEAGAAKSGELSDAQIAAIVTTANQIDIDNGNLALENASHEEVKQFAERMIADHTSVNEAAVELVTRLGVTPEETDTSRGLEKSAEQTRAKMRSLSGEEFDDAYVENEVAYHEAVLQMLDEQLIPAAQNEELKSMLKSVRPAFVAHLEHARSIQSSLRDGSATSHAH